MMKVHHKSRNVKAIPLQTREETRRNRRNCLGGNSPNTWRAHEPKSGAEFGFLRVEVRRVCGRARRRFFSGGGDRRRRQWREVALGVDGGGTRAAELRGRVGVVLRQHCGVLAVEQCASGGGGACGRRRGGVRAGAAAAMRAEAWRAAVAVRFGERKTT